MGIGIKVNLAVSQEAISIKVFHKGMPNDYTHIPYFFNGG